MTHLLGVIGPDDPRHATQRGNRRQRISSAHVAGQGDNPAKVKPFLVRIESPQGFFSSAADDETLVALEKAMGIQLRSIKLGQLVRCHRKPS